MNSREFITMPRRFRSSCSAVDSFSTDTFTRLMLCVPVRLPSSSPPGPPCGGSSDQLPLFVIRSTASLTKGCCLSHSHDALTFNRSSTDGRSFTSFTRHFFTKSMQSGDQPDDDSAGGFSSHTFFITYRLSPDASIT